MDISLFLMDILMCFDEIDVNMQDCDLLNILLQIFHISDHNEYNPI